MQSRRHARRGGPDPLSLDMFRQVDVKCAQKEQGGASLLNRSRRSGWSWNLRAENAKEFGDSEVEKGGKNGALGTVNS